MKYYIVSKSDFNSKKIKNLLIEKINGEMTPINPEYVFTIGGDGTFLKAVHRFPNATFFGIRTGHLGFYTSYSYHDIDLIVESIKEKNYVINELPLLSCYLNNDTNHPYYALNEMTLISQPTTLILDTYIDDDLFEEFRGTGICVATPSGSTGYNKSLGGAIIDNDLLSMQLSEIAGINSKFYETIRNSMILSQKHHFTFKPARKYKTIYFTIDNFGYNLEFVESVEVRIGEKYVKIASKEKADFISKVKKSFLRPIVRKNID